MIKKIAMGIFLAIGVIFLLVIFFQESIFATGIEWYCRHVAAQCLRGDFNYQDVEYGKREIVFHQVKVRDSHTEATPLTVDNLTIRYAFSFPYLNLNLTLEAPTLLIDEHTQPFLEAT